MFLKLTLGGIFHKNKEDEGLAARPRPWRDVYAAWRTQRTHRLGLGLAKPEQVQRRWRLEHMQGLVWRVRGLTLFHGCVATKQVNYHNR